MKILLVTAPFVGLKEPYNGGTETFVVSLANELQSRGHQVDVYAKDTDERNAFHLIAPKPSVLTMQSTIYDDALGQQHFMSFQFGLLDTSQYDVIHYNSYIAEMYEMAAFRSTPSIVTIHLGAKERLTKVYELFCKHAGAVPVSISQRIHDDWAPILQTDSPIIHNGVDLTAWPMRQAANGTGYLLWAGRINADKNVADAIRIAQHLERPLTIVGKIYDQAYFDEYVRPHLSDTIKYVGHVSQAEIRGLIAEASAYLATATWQEPFGLGVLEMLASGLPVVGYTSAIPPELRQGHACVAVDSTEWADLITAVGQAVHVEPQACRAIADMFSIKRMADAYEALYKGLAS